MLLPVLLPVPQVLLPVLLPVLPVPPVLLPRRQPGEREGAW